MSSLQAIRYSPGKLLVLDQRRLPHEHHYDEVSSSEDAFDCIKSMKVRGAPAIAIVAALALAVELHAGACSPRPAKETIAYIDARLDFLKTSRPTAVDLSNAISLLKDAIRAPSPAPAPDHAAVIAAYTSAAERILKRDLATNQAIGAHGAAWLLEQQQQQQAASAEVAAAVPLSVLTHCNTGSLATSGHGTALGIVRSLHARGMLGRAFCTETRPYNQGARLTAFELVHEGIPATLVTDSMAGALLARGRRGEGDGDGGGAGDRAAAAVFAVVVGADRVARDGDTANKIGTFTLAVLARHLGVRFVVAAPTTSIDLATATGADIQIEERPAAELTQISGAVVRPEDGSVDVGRTVRVATADQRIDVWNPAFDVTPHALIDAIVTEEGAVVKGADGRFDFSRVMPQKWAAMMEREA